jgi:DNA-binding MarR family transcriptional regulator
VDPLDRRRVIVRPTPKGRDTWLDYLHAGMAREREFLAALSPRELDLLNALLRKVMLSLDA